MAVEAVIWDFGGVFTSSPFEAFNRYEASRGLPVDFIRRVNATDPHENAWALFESARIDAAGFDAKFLAEATALGHAVRGSEVLPLLSGELRPRMVEALEACKARYKVGCITNNVPQGLSPVRAADAGAMSSADVMALFDEVIESSKVGVRKPDPAIYRMMCEALQVEPAACVYLDDLGINCKPAAQMGMTAIKVVSEAQALADLARATGLTLGLAAA
ncbi:MAG TPA: HAD-IA family hydrolase [Caulobacteraceae bacterium]|nr:HAD-IA family hydrolase [Caulobacteraceae bacterium]